MLSVTRGSIRRQTYIQSRPFKSHRTNQLFAYARLLSSLAVLEQREGKLNNASLGAVTAAQKLGGPITGFIAGTGARSVAEEAAKVKGLEKIIVIENGSYDKVCTCWDLGFVVLIRINHRVSQRISLPCSRKIFKKKGSPMY